MGCVPSTALSPAGPPAVRGSDRSLSELLLPAGFSGQSASAAHGAAQIEKGPKMFSPVLQVAFSSRHVVCEHGPYASALGCGGLPAPPPAPADVASRS